MMHSCNCPDHLHHSPGCPRELEKMRVFATGATRDSDDTKNDYEGFLSPLVLKAYGDYMTKNRQTAAGTRDSDNWQDGIPLSVYIKSLLRHVLDLWLYHRHFRARESVDDAICGIMFNIMGYFHETLKARLASPGEANGREEGLSNFEQIGRLRGEAGDASERDRTPARSEFLDNVIHGPAIDCRGPGCICGYGLVRDLRRRGGNLVQDFDPPDSVFHQTEVGGDFGGKGEEDA